jgi:hypothetical protein
MKSRILLATLALVGGTVLVGHALRSSEPVYEGKKLTVWLEEYDQFGPNVTHEKARTAVRAIGTNAIPTLLRLLNARDSYSKLVVMKLAAKQSLFKIEFTRAATLHSRALAAFRALGSCGRTALPALSAMKREDNFEYTMSVIAGFHEDAEMVFIADLTNRDVKVRRYAAYLLNRSYMDGEISVRALGQALSDSDAEVRRAAAFSLAQLPREPAIAVPALAASLQTEGDNRVKEALLITLRRYGTNAAVMVPLIESAVRDRDPQIAKEAASALDSIQPASRR